MKLGPHHKIVCCCRAGQVRSIAARNFLADQLGFKKVLACGLEWNDRETLDHLLTWADYILVVGNESVWAMLPECYRSKAIFVKIGEDRWGYPRRDEQELHQMLRPMLEQLADTELI